jgi:hypothetical protein
VVRIISVSSIPYGLCQNVAQLSSKVACLLQRG